MRILALTSLYPNPFQPHRAPFNRHWLRLLGERHDVHVISPIAWTDEWAARRRGASPLPPSRQVRLDGLLVDHPRFWFTPKVARGWYGQFFHWSVRRIVRRVAGALRPHLLYAPWAYPDGFAAVRLARELNVPVVIQAHGSDILLLGQHPAKAGPTIETVRSADGIVAVSEHIARRLKALGANPARVRVIHDGVDPAVFHPGSQAEARARLGIPCELPVLVFIGNLVPVKGVDVLIDACAALDETKSPCRIYIIGQGPLRGGLERQARSRGLGDRITFIGALPQAQLPDWYRAADCFVLPSRSEGVPNVLLEAGACGAPWVASDVGGIPEIVVPGRSRLVPPDSPASLAAAIRETLADPRAPSDFRSPKLRTEAIVELESFFHSVLDEQARSTVSPIASGVRS